MQSVVAPDYTPVGQAAARPPFTTAAHARLALKANRGSDTNPLPVYRVPGRLRAVLDTVSVYRLDPRGKIGIERLGVDSATRSRSKASTTRAQMFKTISPSVPCSSAAWPRGRPGWWPSEVPVFLGGCRSARPRTTGLVGNDPVITSPEKENVMEKVAKVS